MTPDARTHLRLAVRSERDGWTTTPINEYKAAIHELLKERRRRAAHHRAGGGKRRYARRV